MEAVRVCQAGFPTRYTYELLWNGMGFKVLVPHAQRHSISPRDGLKIVMAKLDARCVVFAESASNPKAPFDSPFSGAFNSARPSFSSVSEF